METNFQTSFIPKKPIVPQIGIHTSSKGSFFMIFATFLFIVSVAGAGFTYIAKSILLKTQEQSIKDLAEKKKNFNEPLIEDLRRANMKINLANQLFQNHIAVSEVFNIISNLTVDGVRFSSFEFTASDPLAQKEQIFKINMKGVANSFSSVAFQSDVFGKSQKYGTNKVLKNPVLSDLSVDLNGNVLFNFSGEISLPDISYETVLTSILENEALIPK